jgi:ubiquinol-cytochrome c reductase iron-sulfur subunit
MVSVAEGGERPELRRGGQWAPAIAFAVSMVASIALAVVYSTGGQPQAEGVLLFLALGGVGVGGVVWAKRFMPEGPDEEPRGRIGSTDEEIEAFTKDFDEGATTFGRRNFLTKMLLGAVGALGVAALFPIRSLGPRPGRGLKSTPYANGVRLVTEEGSPVRPGDPGLGGVITAFPEGHIGDETAQTLVIRVDPSG